jgi:starvation-inducible outer membrane lipoprotein
MSAAQLLQFGTKIVGVGFLLSGCVTGTKHLEGPDGTDHILIQGCAYIEDCYEAAQKACGGPYTIVNTSGQKGVVYVNDLLIKCGLAADQEQSE